MQRAVLRKVARPEDEGRLAFIPRTTRERHRRFTLPGSLSREDNADLVAFLLAKNGFPAGGAELPTETEILKTIKILTQKP